jgi:hypothetical protein
MKSKYNFADYLIALALAMFFWWAILGSLTGCKVVDLTRDKSTIDSTASRVSKTDSSTYNLVELLLRYGKTTEREYQPGRDSIIIVNGQPQFIQLPGQLTREIIREAGEKKSTEISQTQLSKYDSLTYELLRQNNVKTKATDSTIPWYAFAFAGSVVLLLLVMAIAVLIYVYRKTKSK